MTPRVSKPGIKREKQISTPKLIAFWNWTRNAGTRNRGALRRVPAGRFKRLGHLLIRDNGSRSDRRPLPHPSRLDVPHQPQRGLGDVAVSRDGVQLHAIDEVDDLGISVGGDAAHSPEIAVPAVDHELEARDVDLEQLSQVTSPRDLDLAAVDDAWRAFTAPTPEP